MADSPKLSRESYLDSLPSLVAYARKQPNDNDERLLVLVEEVCHKLDEEKHQREMLNMFMIFGAEKSLL